MIRIFCNNCESYFTYVNRTTLPLEFLNGEIELEDYDDEQFVSVCPNCASSDIEDIDENQSDILENIEQENDRLIHELEEEMYGEPLIEQENIYDDEK